MLQWFSSSNFCLSLPPFRMWAKFLSPSLCLFIPLSFCLPLFASFKFSNCLETRFTINKWFVETQWSTNEDRKEGGEFHRWQIFLIGIYHAEVELYDIGEKKTKKCDCLSTSCGEMGNSAFYQHRPYACCYLYREGQLEQARRPILRPRWKSKVRAVLTSQKKRFLEGEFKF